MEEEKSLQKLNEWYFKYSDDIYRYVLMMTVDQELAKDVTHDTFIKAYKNMESFRGEVSEKNWLYRIAHNTTIDEIRKRKPFRFIVNNYNSLSTNNYLPEKVTQLGESEEQLYRSIQKLKRSYREVIILRKIEELSIQETAEVLNWSEAKVKTTLFRALEALKKQMIKEGALSMNQSKEETKYDDTFKSFQNIKLNNQEKRDIQIKMMKSAEKTKRGEINWNRCPFFNTILAGLLLFLGGYFLINEVILSEEGKRGHENGEFESPYIEIEKEISDILQTPVYIPHHEDLPVKMVMYLISTTSRTDGEVIDQKPEAAVIAYSHLDADESDAAELDRLRNHLVLLLLLKCPQVQFH